MRGLLEGASFETQEFSEIVVSRLPGPGAKDAPEIRIHGYEGRLLCGYVIFSVPAFLIHELLVLLISLFVPNIDTFAVPGIGIDVIDLAIFFVGHNLPLR